MTATALADGAADVRPRFLTAAAGRVVERVVDAYLLSVGEPRRCLTARLARLDLERLDEGAVAALHAVLARHFDAESPSTPRPSAVRLTVFQSRTITSSRQAALNLAASQLHMSVDMLERRLLADLPSERVVVAVSPVPPTAALLQQTNLAWLCRLLARSVSVDIDFRGHPRQVIAALRHARLVVEATQEGALTRIRLSGPLSLHKHTVIYGRSLAHVVRALAWSDEWQVRAHCLLGGELRRVLSSSRDPLLASGTPPTRFDSALEERLHRDFARLGSRWTLHREPTPIEHGGRWLFPDFVAVHQATEQRVFVEVMGFWTADYVARKHAAIAHFGGHTFNHFIVLADATHGLPPKHLPAGVSWVPYRRRIDARALLGALDAAFKTPGEIRSSPDPASPR